MKISATLEKTADYAATFVKRYLTALFLFFCAAPILYIGTFSALSVLSILAFVVAGSNFFLHLALIRRKISFDATHYILSAFSFIVCFFSIYFASKYADGFFANSLFQRHGTACFILVFCASALFTLFYTTGSNMSKVCVSSLLYETKEEETYTCRIGSYYRDDYLPVKYKKKKKQLLKLQEILYEAAVIFRHWAAAIVMLFIAVKLTPGVRLQFFLAWTFFPIAAFIIAALNHVVKILIANSEDADKLAAAFANGIMPEYFIFVICSYTLYFADKFIQGLYVDNLANAYMGGFLFCILHSLFVFGMLIYKNEEK
ncbi:MAG: hypothetical protein LBO62_02955 [Endomicrobium sp.]|jgi:hypothetical protein|nr:hypothetical protein [Endomicrobium sp.]